MNTVNSVLKKYYQDIKDLTTKLNSVNSLIPINANMNTVVQYIDSLPSDGVKHWQAPYDFLDIESILSEAENLNIDSTIYYPCFILLLDNKENIYDNTDIENLQSSYVLYSDGTLEETLCTHTWDSSKDINGFRWMIVYSNTKIIGKVKLNSTSNNSVLGLYIGDCCFSCDLSTFYTNNLRYIKASNITTFDKCKFGKTYLNSLESLILPNLNDSNIEGSLSNPPLLYELILPKIKNTTINNITDLKIIDLSEYLGTISVYQPLYVKCKKFNFYNMTITEGSVFDLSDEQNISGSITIAKHEFKLSDYNITTISYASGLTVNGITKLDLSGLKSLDNGSSSGLWTNGRNSILKEVIIPDSLTYIKRPQYLFGQGVKDSMVRLIIYNNWKISNMDLTSCIKISKESLIDILNKLADVTEEAETYTFTFGETNLAKLTAEEIAVGTAKGWIIN